MRSSTCSNVLCFVILLCVSLGYAQPSVYTYGAPERLFTNTGSPLLLVAPFFAFPNPYCTTGFITVTEADKAAGCVNIHTTGDLTVGGTPFCNNVFIGITELQCSDACAALNPTTNSFIIFNPLGGYIYTVYDGTPDGLVYPQGLSFWFNDDLITTQVYDSGYIFTFDFYYSFSPPFCYGNPSNTLGRNDSVHAIAGVAEINTADVFMAWKGDTYFSHFHTYDGMEYYEKDGFGNITILSTYNNRVHVFDASNNTIFIFNVYGELIATANPPLEIYKLAFSGDYMYAIDSVGVIRYSNALQVTAFTVSDSTCASDGGSLYFEIANGATPVQYRILPDPNHVLTMADPSASEYYYYNATAYGMPKLSPLVYNYTMFGDSWAFGIAIGGDEFTPNGIANASEVTPHSGSTSFAIDFNRTADLNTPSFTMTCMVGYCIDSYRYKAIEFYLWVGDGGQTFYVELVTMVFTTVTPVPQMFINGSELVPNSWNKITIDLMMSVAPHTEYYALQFRETDSTVDHVRNTMYIDDLILVAYDAQYTFLTFDQCGAIRLIPFNITDRTFAATVTTPTVTCNAAGGFNGNKSSDAVANVVLTNGVGPFEYHWNFTGDSSHNTSITNLSSRSSVITIFGDSLNSSWTDASRATSITLVDSTRARTGTSSFSFAPSHDLDLFSFISPTMLDSENYPTIEFWVNGGDVGGQRLTLLIEKQTLHLANPNLESLIQMNSIPPNIWIKVSLSLALDVKIEYNKISLQAMGDFIQPRVYFDDLVILSRQVLTVVDSTGCAAIVDRMAVNTPPPFVYTQTSNNVKCYNGSDGSVSIDLSGGVAPYTYHYSFSSVSDSALPTGIQTTQTGLSESAVTLNIADSNGCGIPPIQYVVLSPPALELTQTIDPVKCNKKSAVITTHTVGGTGPYTYYWASNSPFFIIPQASPVSLFSDQVASGVSLKNATVMCAGTGGAQSPALSYSPSHAGYCSLVPSFNANSSAMSVSCASCMTKDKYIGVNLWIYIQRLADVAKLSFSLKYKNATVQAAASLSSFTNITVAGWNEVYFNFTANTQHDEIVISSSDPTNMGVILLDDVVLMPSDNDGVGISVYPGFKSVIQGTAGDYFLNVIDANGCSVVQKVNITEPAAIDNVADIDYPSSNSATDGSITIKVMGGTPPYSFAWNNTNSTSNELTGVGFGTYELTITDSNGCIFETSVVVDPSKASYLRAFNKGLSTGLAVLVAVGFAISIFAVIILIMYWTQFSLLGSFFCACLLAGVIISYLAAISLLPRPTDHLCTAFPWLLGIAFVFVYGCLFVKTWALYQVWRNAKQYKKTALTPFYILRLIGSLLIVEIVFLIIWTVIDPPTARRVKVVDNSYEIQCGTNHPTFWIIFLAAKGVWLIFGGVLSILTRDVVKKYNESSSISYSIYNIIILLCIGIPLAILLKEVPGGRLVIEVVVTVLAFTFTMCIMFFKNWYNILAQPEVIPTVSKGHTSTARSSGSGSRGSKNSKNSKNSNNSDSDSVSGNPAIRSVSTTAMVNTANQLITDDV